MEGFGIDKLLLILVIVLVLFGARRVPEIGASFGKGIREFKRGMRDIAADDDEPRREAPRREEFRREEPLDAPALQAGAATAERTPKRLFAD